MSKLDVESIRLNSYACGLPAHYRNIDKLLKHIAALEAQIEDLQRQLSQKGTKYGSRTH